MFDLSFKNYGYRLLIACILLNVCGLVFIQSSLTEELNSFISQLIISIGALILCLIISILDLKKVMEKYTFFLIMSIIMLVAVRLLGTASGRNSMRWIVIPIINVQLQPSEFVKLFVILYFSKYIEKLGDLINNPGDLFKLLMLFAIPFLLIFLQPNLSSSLILFFIFFGLLFASKLKRGWFVGGIAIIIVLFSIVFISVKFGFIYKLPLLKDYQKNRIVSFFQPAEKDETRYQQENSVMAIGSGKLFGKGINNDSAESVKNGNWLAEAQNDFIFAIIGEEVGFLGSMIIIIIYLYIIYNCFSIASSQREFYKRLICVGVGTWIGIQAFINLAVATSLIPNTGIPLPFISQGGSSLLAIYMGLGFVLNIKREVRR